MQNLLLPWTSVIFLTEYWHQLSYAVSSLWLSYHFKPAVIVKLSLNPRPNNKKDLFDYQTPQQLTHYAIILPEILKPSQNSKIPRKDLSSPELVHVQGSRVPGTSPPKNIFPIAALSYKDQQIPLLLLRHDIDMIWVCLPVIITVLKAPVIILANEDNVFETDPGDKI